MRWVWFAGEEREVELQKKTSKSKRSKFYRKIGVEFAKPMRFGGFFDQEQGGKLEVFGIWPVWTHGSKRKTGTPQVLA